MKPATRSNSQGACVDAPAEPGSEQGHGLDARILAVSAFPRVI
jgi:hypothetical protein